eukprot:TRINITY_DN3125_c0_g1_i2.p1 TRINITY_DN3125_c0_g1~~TRINITY_DN3125_c0_g1_i2.p1  ORF type:complete len:796 (-),score=134.84 TRINITY_DN3125_c0_g1_i2:68-2455(-)
MFVSSEKKTKFDLLLLADDEFYISDESVVFYPSGDLNDSQRQIRGRIKLCSQSLFFDPHDERLPIVRYEFKFVSMIDAWHSVSGLFSFSSDATSQRAFVIKTKRIVQMRANNAIEPYKFVDGDIIHVFSLNYVSLSDFLYRVERLVKINKQPRHKSSELIRDLIEEKESSTSFDTSWLESLDERPLKELHCIRVTPLVHNPGRLLISNKIVYFQPLNNIDANPVQKFPFSKIIRVIKRRHTLQHVGLELLLEEDRSALFSFKSESIRNSVYTLLTSQPGMTKLQHDNQSQTTFKWQCGLISNFEYLMYLNNAADRTFNDLTQYPVFPWIIADYKSNSIDLNNPSIYRDLSKPIGALNRDRLTGFRQRFNDMDPPKFLYGTHYSTPGYVLYYLVRVAPEYMLRLQNGNFDKADRLFTSVSGAWESVTKHTGDLKELIPEFFIPPGTFLSNTDDLKLGRKQDGTWVGDVELPPWAKNAKEFLKIQKDALESEYVSSNLHHWIDLIFGYKQQGQEAVNADNVFHPLSYEGAVDFDKITDQVERDAMITQINEFGQTPRQLFFKPHPKRFSPEERASKVASYLQNSNVNSPMKKYDDQHHDSGSTGLYSPLSTSGSTRTTSSSSSSPAPLSLSSKDSINFDLGKLDLGLGSLDLKPISFDSLDNGGTIGSGWSSLSQLKPASTLKLHRGKVSGVHLSQDSNKIFSVSHDLTLKVYDVKNQKQLRSIKISNLTLSSIGLSKDEKNVFIGSWDNNIYVYSVDFSRVTDSLFAHDDAVSSLSVDQDMLLSGSWDTTVRVSLS